jgi:hypothetical protein
VDTKSFNDVLQDPAKNMSLFKGKSEKHKAIEEPVNEKQK